MRFPRWLVASRIVLGLVALWLMVGCNPSALRATEVRLESPATTNAAARVRLDSPATTNADPPTVEEYWQLIDDTLSVVRQGRGLASSERAPLLSRAADRLEAVTSVRLPGGQVVPVNNAALAAALRADEADLEQLETWLEALVQVRRAWPRHSPDPGMFDKLAEVLARPEFQAPPERSPSPFDEWLEALNQWLDRWLSRLLLADEARTLGIDWMVLIVGGLTLVGVAYFFWRNVRAHLVREASLAQEMAEADGWSAASATRQARSLATNADYRQAIRYLYLAALLKLDERGVLRYDRALTNREVLHRAGQAAEPHLAQAMSPVVETFDQVWYGFAPVDGETYQAYTEQIEEMMRDA